ncbi:THAP domain-containing protein 5 isoform X1 [Sorex araneus]|uniref:THAP domain-containing protein 5 isoform X1 n=1 Tax=Sorex araneus TaxID=42254 RepID=UPI002433D7A8|nr:THAP domain-containing protein 5 isoform X1 [Sorex araneus]
MPRYCAAVSCKNRRGRNNTDRKLSFYPFPLHDKERLKKWLRNMKRDSWVPSKYQFLCSDHFTPDSLDIRWGIRYLKQTAVPTIFSLPEDNQEKDPSGRSPREKLENEKEICLRAKSEESFASDEPKKKTGNTGIPPEAAKLNDASFLVKPPPQKSGSIQNNLLTLVEQDTRKPDSVMETSNKQDIGKDSFHTSFENLNSTTITLTTSNLEDIQQPLETQEVVEITTNHLSNSNFTNSFMEIKSAQDNPFLISTITQTVEELNTNKDSFIVIFIPTENSEPTINSVVPSPKETMEMEDTDSEDSACEDIDYKTEVLQIEHSYCRKDINKEHLWQKLSKLHSKINLLELQEQQTLGRLKSLEALIRQLKQENRLSEENVNIIENHFSTYEVTIL